MIQNLRTMFKNNNCVFEPKHKVIIQTIDPSIWKTCGKVCISSSFYYQLEGHTL